MNIDSNILGVLTTNTMFAPIVKGLSELDKSVHIEFLKADVIFASDGRARMARVVEIDRRDEGEEREL